MAEGWITRTHPTYDTLQPTWQLLQDAYRGDGGYLDGSNLIAHPREIVYAVDGDGLPTTTVLTHRDKYKRRQKLARYENFARTIIDTFIAHLFAKSINRTPGGLGDDLDGWWDDVDGSGTHIADWMQMEQALAMVYGHVVVIMDQPDTTVLPRTRAEQGQPVLRCYSPLDVLDWIWADGAYQAIKVVEAVPRTSLEDLSRYSNETRGGADGAPKGLGYVIWTPETWTRYDENGKRADGDAHGFGRVPAVIHRARPVPGMPFIGGSILGDPKLHRDHYNMVSELRELLRGQTFSMLNIQLAPDEQVGAARGRLGDAASTETILWSTGPAQFIAPPDGPAATYQAELEALERKLYRMAGLPWEGDAATAESADSRRLKAMDLNRLLAMYADEAERVEYQLVELWEIATSGVTDPAELDAQLTEVVIHYPDEFATIDTAQAAADVRDVATMNLGQTANAEARKRAVPIVLPDLDDDLVTKIEAEIDKAAADAANPQKQAELFRAKVAAAALVKPGEAGQPVPGMAGGSQDAGQAQDAGARA